MVSPAPASSDRTPGPRRPGAARRSTLPMKDVTGCEAPGPVAMAACTGEGFP